MQITVNFEVCTIMHPGCRLLFVFSDNNVSLQSILAEICSNEIQLETRSYMNVRHSHLRTDSCRHFKKSKFSPKAVVKFANSTGSSKGAVDAGGPRREYFRLLIRAVNLEAGVFCGPDDSRVIFPNATGTYNY